LWFHAWVVGVQWSSGRTDCSIILRNHARSYYRV